MEDPRIEMFARDWIEAWNRHDLDSILEFYEETIELSSPFVGKLIGEPTCTIVGKENLRSFFEKSLAVYPDLFYELIYILNGVKSVALVYRSINKMLAVEVLDLNSYGKITKVVAHYND